LKVGEHEVQIGETWPRMTMIDSLQKFANINFEKLSDEEIKALFTKHSIKITGEYNRGKALFALFDDLVPPHLIQPTWITDYPKEISPLAKQHRLNPDFVERFECYIGGKELADGWSEITDAIDQRNRFENEQKHMREGDAEAHPVDEDFLEAMEYGMPPLGGIGMGIDRLVMFLTNTWSIKEVIAFPTLRPLVSGKSKTVAPTSATTPTQAALSATKAVTHNVALPSREESETLLAQYITNAALRHHCHMVARAMEACAKNLGEDAELWYQTGLLHDLDWEMFPDEHPNKAITDLLGNYPIELKSAIAAHAPQRTGKNPETLLEKYLFANDELSGLMHAASLMRPTGFADMEVKSVKKKLKDKSFAANVSRDDINQGFAMIDREPDEHIGFLIEVFKK
jgi:lysyl-tRNA synthetase, class II